MNNKKLLLVGLLFFLIVVLLFINPKHNREKLFNECVVHKDNSTTHTHAMLTITQDGKKITVPDNIGITSECMHPLHTHDTTGLIHMEHPKMRIFYLGEFFDVMGIIFNNKQIGLLKVTDHYTITALVNDKKVSGNFRDISLKDKDKIEILIKSKAYRNK